MRRNICWGNIRYNLRNTPITLEILIKIFRMCWVQVMFWSIVMPKKLNSWTLSIWLPLAHKLSLGIILGCLKNIMNFDLEALSFNLLLWSQDVILEISLLMLLSISVGLLVLPNVSSVKINALTVSGVSRISFRGGGVQNIFGKVGVFAWRSHAFARGVRGHAPPRKFLKIVQFGAFWRIFC